MNTYLRKIKKNTKALSPVIASIILIAVTVAVSVVVAAWMGGMSLGLMNNAEQVTATNPVFTADTAVTLTLRNTGASSVTIVSATIDGKSAALSPADPDNVIPKGESVPFTAALASPAKFSPSAQYQISFVTAKGNTIVYTATYNP
jgi:flagellin-like protein